MAAPHLHPRPGRLQRIAAAFARRPAAEPRDSEGWAIGDMAECVVDGPWVNKRGDVTADPVKGHVGIVGTVRVAPDLFGRYRTFLIFGRWPHRMFDARGFRKLTPRADAATAADAAFLGDLKQRRVPVPSLQRRLAARLERILP